MVEVFLCLVVGYLLIGLVYTWLSNKGNRDFHAQVAPGDTYEGFGSSEIMLRVILWPLPMYVDYHVSKHERCVVPNAAPPALR